MNWSTEQYQFCRALTNSQLHVEDRERFGKADAPHKALIGAAEEPTFAS